MTATGRLKMDPANKDENLKHELQEVAKKLGFSVGGSSFSHDDFDPEVAGRSAAPEKKPDETQQEKKQGPSADIPLKPVKKNKRKKIQKQGLGPRQGECEN